MQPLLNPFASSPSTALAGAQDKLSAAPEVEMPIGPGATSMGVSTSLDTNGQEEWLFTTDSGRPIYRHPGLDPRSTPSAPPGHPDQVRDDDRMSPPQKRSVV